MESRLPSVLQWPSWVWTLVAAEVYVLYWSGVYYAPPGLFSMTRHFWSHQVHFGVPGEHPGVLFPMVPLNILVTLGLWVSVRSARYLPRRHFIPTALTAVAAAVVLAAISWSTISIEKLYPPLKVDRVISLDQAGNYQVREPAR
jgi:hypothetical protein